MDGSLEAEMKAAHPAPEQIRALVEVEQHLMADVARCGCCCCVCACDSTLLQQPALILCVPLPHITSAPHT